MFPLQEHNALLETLLPEDPEPGKVVTFPEGHTVGGSSIISIYNKTGRLIGSASQLAPIPNVSRMYELSRLSACEAVAEKNEIRIIARQFNYNSVIFIQYFGWIGYGFEKNSIVLSDKKYKVIAAIKTGPEEPSGFYLYEKVCLTSTEETRK
jgi:hypothetical protein